MKMSLSRIDAFVYKILKALALSCFVVLLIIMILNVFFRIVPLLTIFPNFSMGWFDEIVELLFAWMVFSTASLLTIKGEHFKVDLLEIKLQGKKIGIILSIIISLLSVAFLGIFLYYSWQLTAKAVQTTPVLNMEQRWMYLCLPVNAFIMLFYTVKELINQCIKLFSGIEKTVQA